MTIRSVIELPSAPKQEPTGSSTHAQARTVADISIATQRVEIEEIDAAQAPREPGDGSASLTVMNK